jgi:hypothetical protein
MNAAFRFMAYAGRHGARTFSRGSAAVAEFRTLDDMRIVGLWLMQNSIRHFYNQTDLSIEVVF